VIAERSQACWRRSPRGLPLVDPRLLPPPAPLSRTHFMAEANRCALLCSHRHPSMSMSAYPRAKLMAEAQLLCSEYLELEKYINLNYAGASCMA